MKLTKKLVKEYLINSEKINEVWESIKEEKLNTYISTEKMKTLWNQFSVVLRDSFCDEFSNIDWEKFHTA